MKKYTLELTKQEIHMIVRALVDKLRDQHIENADFHYNEEGEYGPFRIKECPGQREYVTIGCNIVNTLNALIEDDHDQKIPQEIKEN